MIRGIVHGYEARVPLRVYGNQQREHQIEVIVDTGYDGCLSLRPDLIRALGLDWERIGRGTLADRSQIVFDVYAADVLWDGDLYHVLIDEADTHPLAGMALLQGFELKMECRDQGRVEITPLPE